MGQLLATAGKSVLPAHQTAPIRAGTQTMENVMMEAPEVRSTVHVAQMRTIARLVARLHPEDSSQLRVVRAQPLKVEAASVVCNTETVKPARSAATRPDRSQAAQYFKQSVDVSCTSVAAS